jgi:hypothetical protein
LLNFKYGGEKGSYTQKVDASGQNVEETIQATAEEILQKMISDPTFAEAILNIWNECEQPPVRHTILDRYIREQSPISTNCALFLLAVIGFHAEYLLSGELIHESLQVWDTVYVS